MLLRCSTATAFSDRIVLFHLDGVVPVNWDVSLLDLVFTLPLLAASAIVFVCELCVLRAGALFLTADFVWACCHLRALCFASI